MAKIVNKQYRVLSRTRVFGHNTNECFWAGMPADQEQRMLDGNFVVIVEPVHPRKKHTPEVKLEHVSSEVVLDGAPAETVEAETVEHERK